MIRNEELVQAGFSPSGELIHLSMLRTLKTGKQAILACTMKDNSEQTGYRGGSPETCGTLER